MFDLFKDIDKYKGVPPYASEHYGVYQPLLGWQSKLTKDWLKRGGALIDPRIQRILDGRLVPGPLQVQQGDIREFMAVPLDLAAGRSPFRVSLAKNLNSELLQLILAKVQAFAEANGGRLPLGSEWNQLIEVNDLMDSTKGLLRKVNDTVRARLFKEAVAKASGRALTAEVSAAAAAQHLAQMKYESQIGTFLLSHAEGQGGLLPDSLAQLFQVQEAAPLDEIFRSTDPLANIDPTDTSGVLSPVGYVHLFRQYFFDLGTFLGEPVEHIWLAPGTTIELVEVSTRKVTIERSEETSRETASHAESASTSQDEISGAVKSENSGSTKLGVSTTQSVDYKVYHGTASATLDVESTRKTAREDSFKRTRQQSEKLASDIKENFKSTMRVVSETSDTRSRRYTLQNPTQKLINYELRRKMRRVGVQMQGLGERLCWQVFIDDAGANLGLAELVHFAESPDLSTLKQPDIGPPPEAIIKKVVARVPFQPMRSNDDNGPGADYGNTRPIETFDGKHHGNRVNTNDEDAADAEVVMGPFSFKFDLPKSKYFLADVRVLGPQGSKRATARQPEITNPTDPSFNLVMDSINFGGDNEVLMDVEMVFSPHLNAFSDYEVAKAEAQKKFDADKQRLLEKSFMESVRARIKDASSIKSRPSWDLREEERTVIYRKLIERLMLDSWDLAKKKPQDGDASRLSHVRSELIRAIFDIDAMLYFVAPEWWMPRRHKRQYSGSADFHLTDHDVVKWDDLEKREDNYKITEDSAPARLGSSLGWLLQLDGDNLRNAFLNAPWVKAVIPIRPGREKAALNWLHAIAGHENDGWDAAYVPGNSEDAALVAKLAAEGRPATVGNVLEKIAERLELENGDIGTVLASDQVFEHGFDHLAGGFDASVDPTKPFSQWISVLPTDQLVAIEYVANDLLKP
jgi:hypothetical protein